MTQITQPEITAMIDFYNALPPLMRDDESEIKARMAFQSLDRFMDLFSQVNFDGDQLRRKVETLKTEKAKARQKLRQVRRMAMTLYPNRRIACLICQAEVSDCTRPLIHVSWCPFHDWDFEIGTDETTGEDS